MARVAIIFIPIALLLFAIPVLIGVYVWRDAKGRGMNAPLWTLVSVLAPSLIGFIISCWCVEATGSCDAPSAARE